MFAVWTFLSSRCRGMLRCVKLLLSVRCWYVRITTTRFTKKMTCTPVSFMKFGVDKADGEWIELLSTWKGKMPRVETRTFCPPDIPTVRSWCAKVVLLCIIVSALRPHLAAVIEGFRIGRRISVLQHGEEDAWPPDNAQHRARKRKTLHRNACVNAQVVSSVYVDAAIYGSPFPWLPRYHFAVYRST